MKKSIVFLCLILLFMFPLNATFAQNLCDTYPDPENHTWTAEWTDDFGETKYTLSAPCKVFVDVHFLIDITATDTIFNSDIWVGGLWSVMDTPDGGSTDTVDSGFYIWLDENAEWHQQFLMLYTGAPVNHTVEFSFVDFGQGSGGHNWGSIVIGDIVVDPYPSGPDDDGDGVPDDQDICPGGDDNVDTDGDLIPDFCDLCPIDPENDTDGDGICESDDNCPLIANDNQSDIDGDNIGDVCDNDIDGDTVLNENDNCPFDVNTEQIDTDNDGAGDVCDNDIDGDGVLDADDACVPTPLDEVVNAEGCSISEICPCAHPDGAGRWKNHGAYVRCVAHTSEDFVSAGLITEIEKDAILSEAGISICGHKNQ